MVIDHLHHLVVDGLVVEHVARVAVRAVVCIMHAVVLIVGTVIVVVDFHHVLVRQAGGLHRSDQPVSGDRFPIDVHALHLGGHMLSLLRLALGPCQLLHGASVLDVHGLALLPIGLVHLAMVFRHHIDGSSVGVERLRDVAQFDPARPLEPRPVALARSVCGPPRLPSRPQLP